MGYQTPVSEWGQQPALSPRHASKMPMHQTDKISKQRSTAGASLSLRDKGLEVALSKPTPSPTVKSTTPDLERYLTANQISHITDIARLDRLAEKNAEDIEEAKAMFQNDLRHLHKLIDSQRGLRIQDHVTNEDYSPSAKMREEVSLLSIAESYIEEAEERERVAEKLREQAEALYPELFADEDFRKQIVAIPPRAHSFFCCEMSFASLEYLLKHVDHAHPRHDSVQGSPSQAHPGGRRTDAHVCARLSDDGPGMDLKPTDSTEKSEPEGTKSSFIGWRPLAVRNFPPASVSDSAIRNERTFSWTFLKHLLGGDEWSPGFHFNKAEDCILPGKAYWIIEEDHEPFIPTAPGQHGAKLTAVFHDVTNTSGMEPMPENYMNCPVFIKKNGADGFQYFGQYSQMRYSDKIGYDTLMEHVPVPVRRFHADELSRVGRPVWVTNALINHFWPKPTYEGAIPTDSTCNTPATSATPKPNQVSVLEKHVQKNLEHYSEQLKEWKKMASMKVSCLTADAIFESFNKDDCDQEPGLRLWWEYLQCIGYDEGFYKMLIGLQDLENKKTSRSSSGKTGSKRPVTPPIRNHNDTDLKAGRIFELEGEFNPASILPLKRPESVKKAKTAAQLNREQWKNSPGVNVNDLPPTVFTKPSFANDSSIEKGKQAAAFTKTEQQSFVRTNKNHLRMVKPWEKDDGPAEKQAKQNDDWGNPETTTSWGNETNTPAFSVDQKSTYTTSQLDEAKEFHKQVVRPFVSKNNGGADKRPDRGPAAARTPSTTTPSIAAPASARKPGFVPPHARGK